MFIKYPFLKYVAATLLGLFVLCILIILWIFFWPLTDKRLQTGAEASATYSQAIEKIAKINKLETEKKVEKTCESQLLTHGQKTAKTVVMFHGVTACPSQFRELAEQFFASGYNVYIPRAPYHGTSNPKDHGQVTAQELVTYANESITAATGLGEEVGAIGLSGGAVVATWAAEYRPEVQRLLTLSPFYETAASQAPKWQLPMLKKLHGFHILPEAFSGENNTGFSLRALANYLIVVENLKKDPSNLHLKSIGTVVSASDDVIDLDLALTIPSKIAKSNNLTLLSRTLPKEWNVGHAIVAPDEKGVAERKAELFSLYQAFYEGRQP